MSGRVKGTTRSPWGRRRLSEIADIGAGNSAPQDKRLFEEGLYPFIRTSDVGRVRFGEIGCSADRLNEAGAQGLKLVPSGSILIPKSGASTFLNHRVQTTVDSYVASHLATVGAKPDKALNRYLLYFLATVRAQDLVQDNQYPSLTLAAIGAIEVPAPPLAEQARITAILDQAFVALDDAGIHVEANLADAKALFDSVLVTTFDNLLPQSAMMTLASAANDFSRGKSRHRPRNAPELYGGRYPFIQTGDIRRSEGSIREFSQTYSEAGLAQSKLWPVGTVCITIAANIAETGVMEFEGCFPDSVIGMVPDPKVADPYYVEYMLRYFAEELKQKGKGAAQDNINLATFESALFPFPSLEQQRAVVEKLDGIAAYTKHARQSYEQTVTDIASLRQSLLQQAFSGRL